MKTLIPVLCLVNILSFIAGHFWVNDKSNNYSALLLIPVLCGVLTLASLVLAIDSQDF